MPNHPELTRKRQETGGKRASGVTTAAPTPSRFARDCGYRGCGPLTGTFFRLLLSWPRCGTRLCHPLVVSPESPLSHLRTMTARLGGRMIAVEKTIRTHSPAHWDGPPKSWRLRRPQTYRFPLPFLQSLTTLALPFTVRVHFRFPFSPFPFLDCARGFGGQRQ